MKKVWLFSRMSTFTGNENLKNLMDNCRKKALEKGYRVVGETIIVGSSDLAKAAIKDIIEHNDSKNGAESIFSVNGNSLSHDLKTAQEIFDFISQSGMEFVTSSDDVVLLDKNNPVGAVFNLMATGQKELPDDFQFEDESGMEPAIGEPKNNGNTLSM